MAKTQKSFTTKDELSIFEETSNTKNTDNTKNTKSTKGRPATTDTETQGDDYRFNARFTALQGKYIQEKAWQTRKSITATLQNIIEEDMKRKENKHIVDAIDELNG